MSKKTKIVAVASMLLGYKRVSNVYLEALQQDENFDVFTIPIETSDYKKYISDRRFRISDSQDVADIAQAKYNELVNFDYDLLFINGYEIALGLKEAIKNHKTIIGLDAVPGLVHQQIRRSTKSYKQKLRSHLAEYYTGSLFKAPFKDVDFFFPLSHWCADGIEKIYDVPADQMKVFYTPTDLKKWQPRDNSKNPKFQLLFVGNDFHRKGGDQVLSYFTSGELSSQEYQLNIVSNDPCLDGMTPPAGVNFLKNISPEQIARLFIESNVFVFPTKKEYLGNVATESLSAGVPVIARDTGALKEFVKDGYNGFLMAYDSNDQQWIEKIRHLNEHRELCETYGQNARLTAEKLFNLETFNQETLKYFQKVIA